MNLIEFFGTVIKPIIAKGKYMFSPINNKEISQGLYALKDKDVNVFIFRNRNDIIAIDSGYKNTENITNELRKYNINENDISNVFITHLDLDHAGGIDNRCRKVFPNAKIYIGKIEEKYLKNELNRKQIGFFGLKSPIKLSNGYYLLEDKQIIHIGTIKLQAFLVPGHTLGHLWFLINDKYLFTGDSIILVKGNGYSFYNQWNVNSSMNIKSIKKIKNIIDINSIEIIITSHSGYTNNIINAFSQIDKLPNWRTKGYKVNDEAPYNPYKN